MDSIEDNLNRQEYQNVLDEIPSEPWTDESKDSEEQFQKELLLKKYQQINVWLENNETMIQVLREHIEKDKTEGFFTQEWKKFIEFDYQDIKKLMLGKNEYSHELRLSATIPDIFTQEQIEILQNIHL